MICWGGSLGEHPCQNEATDVSGLCEDCAAFATRISQALTVEFKR